MLRMHCLQHWYALADEALENARYDNQALRSFVGIDLLRESMPDATTLLKFRPRLPAEALRAELTATVCRKRIATMGQRGGDRDKFLHSFNFDDHLLRGIDEVLDLGDPHSQIAPLYSHAGRPSVDPELMIRMLIVGYCFGIRSEAGYAKRDT